MYLTHLTYRTSQFSLANLQCTQNTYISPQLAKTTRHNVYFTEVQSTSRNLLREPLSHQPTAGKLCGTRSRLGLPVGTFFTYVFL